VPLLQALNPPVDPAAKAAYNKCVQAHYRYLEGSYAHTTAVFAWQLLESNIVFFVVVGLVVVGVVLSWLQFKEALAQGAARRMAMASGTTTGGVTAATTVAPSAGAEQSAVQRPAESTVVAGPDSAVEAASRTDGGTTVAAPDSSCSTTQAVPGVSGTAAEACAVDMKLSPDGIEVRTSVLGVVILLISMAFFFLYLKYVYPIVILPQ